MFFGIALKKMFLEKLWSAPPVAEPKSKAEALQSSL